MKKQKKYDLDEELDKVDLTQHIEKAQWISKEQNPRNAGRKKIGKRVSIILPAEVIEKLQAMSKTRGLGYQTLARLFIMQKINDEEHKKNTAA